MPTVAVIVVAAGEGSRLEAGVPKAFAELRGRTILERALDGIHQSVEPAQVVIVAPKSHLRHAQRLAPTRPWSRAATPRQDSVAAGLAALDTDVQTVLVHDAARALCPGELFDRVTRAVVATGAGVIPALPVTDTIKRVADEQVLDTVDRSSSCTCRPRRAFRRMRWSPHTRTPRRSTPTTPRCSRRRVVPSAPCPARPAPSRSPCRGTSAAPRTSSAPPARCAPASAWTCTATTSPRPLWLGGLYWPDEPGLAGHSDGDALAHAICDALLAAAGLGDIGGRFGTDDPRFADAHGEVFITETVALVEGAGFTVGNVAVQLVGNRPKLGPRRGELERHLTDLVGAPVSVAATTTDGLGFTGEGQGVVAIATALVRMAPWKRPAVGARPRLVP